MANALSEAFILYESRYLKPEQGQQIFHISGLIYPNIRRRKLTMSRRLPVDYYEVLGLEPYTEIREVKKAYRKLGKPKGDATQLKLILMSSSAISPG